MKLPPLLILTVGAGTAGRDSNIVQGLRRTIELLQPEAFWLIPSTTGESLATAERVREGLTAYRSFPESVGSSPAGTGSASLVVEFPDDLEHCRRTFRIAIDHVRTQLRRGQRLLVNPTSGTKQMTVGATFAALDAGIGEIVFTVGDRRDGVVITGTERLATFDAALWFAERDLALALEFAGELAYDAAAHLLRTNIAAGPGLHATAQCLAAWSRLDYATAASFAAEINEDLHRHLAALATTVADKNMSPELVADVVAWADLRLRNNEPDDALALTYKALEFGANLRLSRYVTGPPPYSLHRLLKLPIRPRTRRRLQTLARDGTVFMGLTIKCQLLQQLGDPFGKAFFSDSRLAEATARRNEHVHNIRPVSTSESRQLLDLTRNLFAATLALPAPFPRPVLKR